MSVALICNYRWLWHIVESGQVSSMVRSFASVKDPKAAGGKEKIRSLAADLVQQRRDKKRIQIQTTFSIPENTLALKKST